MRAANRAESMGTDGIWSLLVRFSLPATLAMMVMASYNIADTIFVGRLGSQAIAALSVSFPVQMLFGAVGIGTGVGAGSLISRSLGAGDRGEASRTAGQVFFLTALFGVLTAGLGLRFLEPLLITFGATPEILPHTVEYMGIVIAGSIFLYGIMMMNNAVRSEGNPMYPMVVMIGSSLLNIALDPIFIFALGLGIRGAAVATVISKALGFSALLYYYLSGRSSLSVSAKDLAPYPPTILEIYRVGIPSLLMQMATNLSLLVVNNILGVFGYIPIAVMGLIIRLQQFAFMPVIGISQGLLPIIGYNFGARKYPRIKEALLKGGAAGTAFMTVMGILFFAYPQVFLGIFTDDPRIMDMGVEALRYMVLMYPLIAGIVVSRTLFQAIGRGMPALLLALLREVILYIPLILVVPNYLDITGIWVSRPVADALTFAVTALVVAREFRRRGLALVGSSEDLEPVGEDVAGTPASSVTPDGG